MVKAMGQQGMRDLEVASLHELHVGQDLCRIALGDESASVQDQNPGAEVQDHFQIVARQNPGILEVVELLDELAT